MTRPVPNAHLRAPRSVKELYAAADPGRVPPVHELPLEARTWAARRLMEEGHINGWQALELIVYGSLGEP